MKVGLLLLIVCIGNVYGQTTTPSPTVDPTPAPSPEPSKWPTAGPSKWPTAGPSKWPTAGPSKLPTPSPTAAPTPGPSPVPSPAPTTAEPTTVAPTTAYPTSTGPTTAGPTAGPSKWPTAGPTKWPTRPPSHEPSHSPSPAPTPDPTPDPTPEPSAEPSAGPIDAIDPIFGDALRANEKNGDDGDHSTMDHDGGEDEKGLNAVQGYGIIGSAVILSFVFVAFCVFVYRRKYVNKSQNDMQNLDATNEIDGTSGTMPMASVNLVELDVK